MYDAACSSQLPQGFARVWAAGSCREERERDPSTYGLEREKNRECERTLVIEMSFFFFERRNVVYITGLNLHPLDFLSFIIYYIS